VALSNALLRAKDAVSVHLRQWFESRTVRLVMTGVTTAVLAILALYGWNASRKPRAEAAANPPAAQVQPAASAPAASTELVWKPNPAHVSASPLGAKSGIQPAAKREVDQIATAAPLSPQPPTLETKIVTEASEPAPAPNAAIEAPAMEAIAPAKNLPSMASVPVNMPAFGSPVSEGISGGVLQHKVQPVYPLQALPMRLRGSVILQATIGEKGKVDDVKVVSGPPLLTAAAIDAVRQWRYTPFLLNGKPVKMQKEITINFQAP
jgi:TonB family protein